MHLLTLRESGLVLRLAARTVDCVKRGKAAIVVGGLTAAGIRTIESGGQTRKLMGAVRLAPRWQGATVAVVRTQEGRHDVRLPRLLCIHVEGNRLVCGAEGLCTCGEFWAPVGNLRLVCKGGTIVDIDPDDPDDPDWSHGMVRLRARVLGPLF